MNNATNLKVGDKITIPESGSYQVTATTSTENSVDENKKVESQKKKNPVNASIYQRMTEEQKKDFFPVNRAMRRKAGIR